jgi:hypothetical protein
VPDQQLGVVGRDELVHALGLARFHNDALHESDRELVALRLDVGLGQRGLELADVVRDASGLTRRRVSSPIVRMGLWALVSHRGSGRTKTPIG